MELYKQKNKKQKKKKNQNKNCINNKKKKNLPDHFITQIKSEHTHTSTRPNGIIRKKKKKKPKTKMA